MRERVAMCSSRHFTRRLSGSITPGSLVRAGGGGNEFDALLMSFPLREP